MHMFYYALFIYQGQRLSASFLILFHQKKKRVKPTFPYTFPVPVPLFEQVSL